MRIEPNPFPSIQFHHQDSYHFGVYHKGRDKIWRKRVFCEDGRINNWRGLKSISVTVASDVLEKCKKEAMENWDECTSLGWKREMESSDFLRYRKTPEFWTDGEEKMNLTVVYAHRSNRNRIYDRYRNIQSYETLMFNIHFLPTESNADITEATYLFENDFIQDSIRTFESELVDGTVREKMAGLTEWTFVFPCEGQAKQKKAKFVVRFGEQTRMIEEMDA